MFGANEQRSSTYLDDVSNDSVNFCADDFVVVELEPEWPIATDGKLHAHQASDEANAVGLFRVIQDK